jgi:hypothetical protein
MINEITSLKMGIVEPVTFYMIQHKYNCVGDWGYSNFDSFGSPHNDFTSSGEVWQKYGHHGTFVFENAVAGLIHLQRTNPNHAFRIVRRTIVDYYEPVCEMSGVEI